jgi:DNA-binding LytR/AlgR family response regulator
MKIRSIAVDDEVLALQKITRFCNQIEYIDLVATFENPLDALHYLKHNHVDLAFIDIKMDGMSGLELLGKLESPLYAILTTAFSHYSLKAFDLDVVDYLVKPIRPERFRVATDKVRERVAKDRVFRMVNDTDKEINPEYIFLKSGYSTRKVYLRDILYIEGMRDYLSVRTYSSRILVLQIFEIMLKILPAERFLRVHRSYIIALDKIDSYNAAEVVINGRELPVSKTYRKQFLSLMEKR